MINPIIPIFSILLYCLALQFCHASDNSIVLFDSEETVADFGSIYQCHSIGFELTVHFPSDILDLADALYTLDRIESAKILLKGTNLPVKLTPGEHYTISLKGFSSILGLVNDYLEFRIGKHIYRKLFTIRVLPSPYLIKPLVIDNIRRGMPVAFTLQLRNPLDIPLLVTNFESLDSRVSFEYLSSYAKSAVSSSSHLSQAVPSKEIVTLFTFVTVPDESLDVNGLLLLSTSEVSFHIPFSVHFDKNSVVGSNSSVVDLFQRNSGFDLIALDSSPLVPIHLLNRIRSLHTISSVNETDEEVLNSHFNHGGIVDVYGPSHLAYVDNPSLNKVAYEAFSDRLRELCLRYQKNPRACEVKLAEELVPNAVSQCRTYDSSNSWFLRDCLTSRSVFLYNNQMRFVELMDIGDSRHIIGIPQENVSPRYRDLSTWIVGSTGFSRPFSVSNIEDNRVVMEPSATLFLLSNNLMPEEKAPGVGPAYLNWQQLELGKSTPMKVRVNVTMPKLQFMPQSISKFSELEVEVPIAVELGAVGYRAEDFLVFSPSLMHKPSMLLHASDSSHASVQKSDSNYAEYADSSSILEDYGSVPPNAFCLSADVLLASFNAFYPSTLRRVPSLLRGDVKYVLGHGDLWYWGSIRPSRRPLCQPFLTSFNDSLEDDNALLWAFECCMRGGLPALTSGYPPSEPLSTRFTTDSRDDSQFAESTDSSGSLGSISQLNRTHLLRPLRLSNLASSHARLTLSPGARVGTERDGAVALALPRELAEAARASQRGSMFPDPPLVAPGGSVVAAAGLALPLWSFLTPSSDGVIAGAYESLLGAYALPAAAMRAFLHSGDRGLTPQTRERLRQYDKYWSALAPAQPTDERTLHPLLAARLCREVLCAPPRRRPAHDSSSHTFPENNGSKESLLAWLEHLEPSSRSCEVLVQLEALAALAPPLPAPWLGPRGRPSTRQCLLSVFVNESDSRESGPPLDQLSIDHSMQRFARSVLEDVLWAASHSFMPPGAFSHGAAMADLSFQSENGPDMSSYRRDEEILANRLLSKPPAVLSARLAVVRNAHAVTYLPVHFVRSLALVDIVPFIMNETYSRGGGMKNCQCSSAAEGLPLLLGLPELDSPAQKGPGPRGMEEGRRERLNFRQRSHLKRILRSLRAPRGSAFYPTSSYSPSAGVPYNLSTTGPSLHRGDPTETPRKESLGKRLLRQLNHHWEREVLHQAPLLALTAQLDITTSSHLLSLPIEIPLNASFNVQDSQNLEALYFLGLESPSSAPPGGTVLLLRNVAPFPLFLRRPPALKPALQEYLQLFYLCAPTTETAPVDTEPTFPPMQDFDAEGLHADCGDALVLAPHAVLPLRISSLQDGPLPMENLNLSDAIRVYFSLVREGGAAATRPLEQAQGASPFDSDAESADIDARVVRSSSARKEVADHPKLMVSISLELTRPPQGAATTGGSLRRAPAELYAVNAGLHGDSPHLRLEGATRVSQEEFFLPRLLLSLPPQAIEALDPVVAIDAPLNLSSSFSAFDSRRREPSLCARARHDGCSRALQAGDAMAPILCLGHNSSTRPAQQRLQECAGTAFSVSQTALEAGVCSLLPPVPEAMKSVNVVPLLRPLDTRARTLLALIARTPSLAHRVLLPSSTPHRAASGGDVGEVADFILDIETAPVEVFSTIRVPLRLQNPHDEPIAVSALRLVASSVVEGHLRSDGCPLDPEGSPLGSNFSSVPAEPERWEGLEAFRRGRSRRHRFDSAILDDSALLHDETIREVENQRPQDSHSKINVRDACQPPERMSPVRLEGGQRVVPAHSSALVGELVIDSAALCEVVGLDLAHAHAKDGRMRVALPPSLECLLRLAGLGGSQLAELQAEWTGQTADLRILSAAQNRREIINRAIRAAGATQLVLGLILHTDMGLAPLRFTAPLRSGSLLVADEPMLPAPVLFSPASYPFTARSPQNTGFWHPESVTHSKTTNLASMNRSADLNFSADSPLRPILLPPSPLTQTDYCVPEHAVPSFLALHSSAPASIEWDVSNVPQAVNIRSAPAIFGRQKEQDGTDGPSGGLRDSAEPPVDVPRAWRLSDDAVAVPEWQTCSPGFIRVRVLAGAPSRLLLPLHNPSEHPVAYHLAMEPAQQPSGHAADAYLQKLEHLSLASVREGIFLVISRVIGDLKDTSALLDIFSGAAAVPEPLRAGFNQSSSSLRTDEVELQLARVFLTLSRVARARAVPRWLRTPLGSAHHSVESLLSCLSSSEKKMGNSGGGGGDEGKPRERENEKCKLEALYVAGSLADVILLVESAVPMAEPILHPHSLSHPMLFEELSQWEAEDGHRWACDASVPVALPPSARTRRQNRTARAANAWAGTSRALYARNPSFNASAAEGPRSRIHRASHALRTRADHSGYLIAASSAVSVSHESVQCALSLPYRHAFAAPLAAYQLVAAVYALLEPQSLRASFTRRSEDCPLYSHSNFSIFSKEADNEEPRFRSFLRELHGFWMESDERGVLSSIPDISPESLWPTNLAPFSRQYFTHVNAIKKEQVLGNEEVMEQFMGLARGARAFAGCFLRSNPSLLSSLLGYSWMNYSAISLGSRTSDPLFMHPLGAAVGLRPGRGLEALETPACAALVAMLVPETVSAQVDNPFSDVFVVRTGLPEQRQGLWGAAALEARAMAAWARDISLKAFDFLLEFSQSPQLKKIDLGRALMFSECLAGLLHSKLRPADAVFMAVSFAINPLNASPDIRSICSSLSPRESLLGHRFLSLNQTHLSLSNTSIPHEDNGGQGLRVSQEMESAISQLLLSRRFATLSSVSPQTSYVEVSLRQDIGLQSFQSLLAVVLSKQEGHPLLLLPLLAQHLDSTPGDAPQRLQPSQLRWLLRELGIEGLRRWQIPSSDDSSEQEEILVHSSGPSRDYSGPASSSSRFVPLFVPSDSSSSSSASHLSPDYTLGLGHLSLASGVIPPKETVFVGPIVYAPDRVAFVLPSTSAASPSSSSASTTASFSAQIPSIAPEAVLVDHLLLWVLNNASGAEPVWIVGSAEVPVLSHVTEQVDDKYSNSTQNEINNSTLLYLSSSIASVRADSEQGWLVRSARAGFERSRAFVAAAARFSLLEEELENPDKSEKISPLQRLWGPVERALQMSLQPWGSREYIVPLDPLAVSVSNLSFVSALLEPIPSNHKLGTFSSLDEPSLSLSDFPTAAPGLDGPGALRATATVLSRLDLRLDLRSLCQQLWLCRAGLLTLHPRSHVEFVSHAALRPSSTTPDSFEPGFSDGDAVLKAWTVWIPTRRLLWFLANPRLLLRLPRELGLSQPAHMEQLVFGPPVPQLQRNSEEFQLHRDVNVGHEWRHGLSVQEAFQELLIPLSDEAAPVLLLDTPWGGQELVIPPESLKAMLWKQAGVHYSGNPTKFAQVDIYYGEGVAEYVRDSFLSLVLAIQCVCAGFLLLAKFSTNVNMDFTTNTIKLSDTDGPLGEKNTHWSPFFALKRLLAEGDPSTPLVLLSRLYRAQSVLVLLILFIGFDLHALRTPGGSSPSPHPSFLVPKSAKGWLSLLWDFLSHLPVSLNLLPLSVVPLLLHLLLLGAGLLVLVAGGRVLRAARRSSAIRAVEELIRELLQARRAREELRRHKLAESWNDAVAGVVTSPSHPVAVTGKRYKDRENKDQKSRGRATEKDSLRKVPEWAEEPQEPAGVERGPNTISFSPSRERSSSTSSTVLVSERNVAAPPSTPTPKVVAAVSNPTVISNPPNNPKSTKRLEKSKEKELVKKSNPSPSPTPSPPSISTSTTVKTAVTSVTNPPITPSSGTKKQSVHPGLSPVSSVNSHPTRAPSSLLKETSKSKPKSVPTPTTATTAPAGVVVSGTTVSATPVVASSSVGASTSTVIASGSTPKVVQSAWTAGPPLIRRSRLPEPEAQIKPRASGLSSLNSSTVSAIELNHSSGSLSATDYLDRSLHAPRGLGALRKGRVNISALHDSELESDVEVDLNGNLLDGAITPPPPSPSLSRRASVQWNSAVHPSGGPQDTLPLTSTVNSVLSKSGRFDSNTSPFQIASSAPAGVPPPFQPDFPYPGGIGSSIGFGSPFDAAIQEADVLNDSTGIATIMMLQNMINASPRASNSPYAPVGPLNVSNGGLGFLGPLNFSLNSSVILNQINNIQKSSQEQSPADAGDVHPPTQNDGGSPPREDQSSETNPDFTAVGTDQGLSNLKQSSPLSQSSQSQLPHPQSLLPLVMSGAVDLATLSPAQQQEFHFAYFQQFQQLQQQQVYLQQQRQLFMQHHSPPPPPRPQASPEASEPPSSSGDVLKAESSGSSEPHTSSASKRSGGTPVVASSEESNATAAEPEEAPIVPQVETNASVPVLNSPEVSVQLPQVPTPLPLPIPVPMSMPMPVSLPLPLPLHLQLQLNHLNQWNQMGMNVNLPFPWHSGMGISGNEGLYGMGIDRFGAAATGLGYFPPHLGAGPFSPPFSMIPPTTFLNNNNNVAAPPSPPATGSAFERGFAARGAKNVPGQSHHTSFNPSLNIPMNMGLNLGINGIGMGPVVYPNSMTMRAHTEALDHELSAFLNLGSNQHASDFVPQEQVGTEDMPVNTSSAASGVASTPSVHVDSSETHSDSEETPKKSSGSSSKALTGSSGEDIPLTETNPNQSLSPAQLDSVSSQERAKRKKKGRAAPLKLNLAPDGESSAAKIAPPLAEPASETSAQSKRMEGTSDGAGARSSSSEHQQNVRKTRNTTDTSVPYSTEHLTHAVSTEESHLINRESEEQALEQHPALSPKHETDFFVVPAAGTIRSSLDALHAGLLSSTVQSSVSSPQRVLPSPASSSTPTAPAPSAPTQQGSGSKRSNNDEFDLTLNVDEVISMGLASAGSTAANSVNNNTKSPLFGSLSSMNVPLMRNMGMGMGMDLNLNGMGMNLPMDMNMPMNMNMGMSLGSQLNMGMMNMGMNNMNMNMAMNLGGMGMNMNGMAMNIDHINLPHSVHTPDQDILSVATSTLPTPSRGGTFDLAFAEALSPSGAPITTPSDQSRSMPTLDGLRHMGSSRSVLSLQGHGNGLVSPGSIANESNSDFFPHFEVFDIQSISSANPSMVNTPTHSGLHSLAGSPNRPIHRSLLSPATDLLGMNRRTLHPKDELNEDDVAEDSINLLDALGAAFK